MRRSSWFSSSSRGRGLAKVDWESIEVSLKVFLCKTLLIPTRGGITKGAPQWAWPETLLWKDEVDWLCSWLFIL